MLGGNAGAAVADHDDSGTALGLERHLDLAPVVGLPVDGVHRVEDQVDEHLLGLDAADDDDN
jgi:hypothetical protein